MASATASDEIGVQNLKSHFPPIGVLVYGYWALISSKNCIIFAKLKDYLTNYQTDLIQALYHKLDVKKDFANVLQFFSLISESLKVSKSRK